MTISTIRSFNILLFCCSSVITLIRGTRRQLIVNDVTILITNRHSLHYRISFPVNNAFSFWLWIELLAFPNSIVIPVKIFRLPQRRFTVSIKTHIVERTVGFVRIGHVISFVEIITHLLVFSCMSIMALNVHILKSVGISIVSIIWNTLRVPSKPKIASSSLIISTVHLSLIGEVDNVTLTVAHRSSYAVLASRVSITLYIRSSALTWIMKERNVFSISISLCIRPTGNHTLIFGVLRIYSIVAKIHNRRKSIYMALRSHFGQHIHIAHTTAAEAVTLNEFQVLRQSNSAIAGRLLCAFSAVPASIIEWSMSQMVNGDITINIIRHILFIAVKISAMVVNHVRCSSRSPNMAQHLLRRIESTCPNNLNVTRNAEFLYIIHITT